jgi:hypothetical protein
LKNDSLEAFISYSRKDGEFVSQLQTHLAASRFDTWRDTNDLRAGDRWPQIRRRD